MERPFLSEDLREFLKLLNLRKVKYLLIGGYAVGYYGYSRSTADMDIWVGISLANADKLVGVLREFGFDVPELRPELFLRKEQIVRMGEPPYRIEILTTISGVEFEECYSQKRRVHVKEGLKVNLISLPDLKKNKAASGRPKDLDDLQRLEILHPD